MTNLRSQENQFAFSIRRIIKHPLYHYHEEEHDIALIEIVETINFTLTQLRAISLPSKEVTSYSGYGTVAGWGKTWEQGTNVMNLLAVDVPIVSDRACRRVYGARQFRERSMICAGEGGKDSCQVTSSWKFSLPNIFSFS